MELVRFLGDRTSSSNKILYTSSVITSNTFLPGPIGVLLWSDQNCYFDVTRTDAGFPVAQWLSMPANTPIPVRIPGDGFQPFKIWASGITTSGVLYYSFIGEN